MGRKERSWGNKEQRGVEERRKQRRSRGRNNIDAAPQL